MDPRKLTPEQLDQIRRFRGCTKATLRSGLGVVYFSAPNDRGRIRAQAFTGKAIRPAWHYSFRSPERLAAYVAEWEAGLQRSVQFKAEQAAKRKAEGNSLQVGDVLSSVWGYDQTNVNYYQVTRRTASSVWVRPIAQDSREDRGSMMGTCTPMKGRFTGPEVMRRAKGNGVRVSTCQWASKVEPMNVAGVEVFPTAEWTSYA